jgi:hypothetical protein
MSSEELPWFLQNGDREITEIQIVHLARDIMDLRKHQEEQDRLIEELREERDRALVWGILALGGLVITLIGVIVTFVKDHIKWLS